MSPPSEPALPEHLGSWLAAYCDCDAAATREEPANADTPDDPFLPRLERAANCLWLLEHAWPYGEPLAVTELGHYKIIAKLGQGGMGTVYEAVHTLLKRPVALKVLRPDRLGNAQAVRRFHREMEAVGKLDHPNIVRASDAGAADGTHFLAMELVEGIDLGKLLWDQGPLREADACEIVRQAAVALDHVHRHGLVHRDIKPSNLMLTRSGRIKLLDLGLARLVPEAADEQTALDTYKLIGTLDYIAPEQATGPSSVDIRADLYSLGCVLSKLVTGEVQKNSKWDPPANTARSSFRQTEEATSASRDARVTEALAKVLNRLVASSPSRRFSTPAEAVLALEPLAQGHDLRALARKTCGVPLSNEVFEKSALEHAAVAEDALQAPSALQPSVRNPVVGESPSKAKTNRRKLGGVLAAVCLIVPAAALALPHTFFRASRWETTDTKSTTASAVKSTTIRKLGTWDLPPSGEPLPGLVPQPAMLPGIGRWQVDTIAPRGRVYGMAWSPDGRLLAVGSSDHYIRVYEVATQRLVRVFAGHTRNIPCLAWSPDGRWLASAGGFRDWSVRLWSVLDGKPGPMIETHWGAQSVTWSPDSRRLAFVRRSPTDHVQVWDPFEGTLITSFTHESRRLFSVAWSPDGNWIASLGDDALRLWNAQQGTPGPVFAGAAKDKSGHFTQLLAWSPDSQWIAAPGTDRTIRTWDVIAEKEGPLLKGHSDAVKSVAWSPDGAHIASGGFDATIRVWDAATGEQRRVLKHAWWVASVVWSPNGRQLASGSRSGTVRGWDSETGKQLWEIGTKWQPGLNTGWASVDWSPDGRTLATGGADGAVRLWDVDRAEQQDVLRGHESSVDWVRWSPDSRSLASATYGPYGTIRLWDAREGFMKQSLTDFVAGSPAWSHDGRLIAVPGYRNVQIYDAEEGGLVRGLHGHTDHVLAVQWSPDGRWLASGGDDRTVRLWSATDGQVMAVLKGHNEAVGWLRWSPASDFFVSAGMIQGKGGSLRQWNLSANSALGVGEFDLEKSFPTAAWSGDLRWLATGHDNGDLWIRDGKEGTPSLLLAGHAESLRQLTWSPDDHRIASVSDDYSLRIWDAASGSPIWFALLLPSGQAALFTPLGELLNPDAAILEQLIYLAEQPSGAMELVAPSRFHKIVRRQPTSNARNRQDETAIPL